LSREKQSLDASRVRGVSPVGKEKVYGGIQSDPYSFYTELLNSKTDKRPVKYNFLNEGNKVYRSPAVREQSAHLLYKCYARVVGLHVSK